MGFHQLGHHPGVLVSGVFNSFAKLGFPVVPLGAGTYLFWRRNRSWRRLVPDPAPQEGYRPTPPPQ